MALRVQWMPVAIAIHEHETRLIVVRKERRTFSEGNRLHDIADPLRNGRRQACDEPGGERSKRYDHQRIHGGIRWNASTTWVAS